MPTIRCITTTTVQASSNDESIEKIDLTPWDLELLHVGPIQKGLLFHKPPQSSSTSLIHHLRTTLSRTLSFFPPLAGRLASTIHDDTSTSFFIHCNNAGAQLTHAIAENIHAAHIVNSQCVMNHFFSLNKAMNYEGVTKPLLAVQVTELADGVFIGCTINHTVADGSSFWHFFNSWAEISRGFDEISRPPVLERWFPPEISRPIHFQFCKPKGGGGEELFKSPPLQEKVFHFTKEKIVSLKTQANSKMGSTKISSLQALMAHIWLSVVRSKKLGPDHEVKFKFLIGARPRIRPPLPEGYFGNAVHFQTLAARAGDLEKGGFSWAALEMNKMIAQQTSDEIVNFLKDWVDEPKIVKMGAVTSNALIVSSSPWFKVYDCDFGWGKPVAVRSGGGNKHDGKLTVFPGKEEGSIDIEVCLLPETLSGLEHDVEFMKYAKTSQIWA